MERYPAGPITIETTIGSRAEKYERPTAVKLRVLTGMSIIALMMVLGGAASAAAEPTTPAPSGDKGFTLSSPNADGYFQIYFGLNKCLDASGTGQGQNGTPIQIWDCNGTSNQLWRIAPRDGSWIALILLNGQRCLSAPGSNPHPGAQLILWDCNGGHVESWYRNYTSSGWVVLGNEGASYEAGNPNVQVMDLRNSNTSNGNAVQIWDVNGTAAQLWSLP